MALDAAPEDEIATTYILTDTKGKARRLGTKAFDAITGEGTCFFFKMFIYQLRPYIFVLFFNEPFCSFDADLLYFKMILSVVITL